MAFDSFENSLQSRRSVYPVWLRFFTFIAALVAAVILLGPSFRFSNTDPSLPWNEQHRILPENQTVEIMPNPDQPQLTHVVRYKTQVEQENGPRGAISILVYPDGSVKGVWNGEYDKPVSVSSDANLNDEPNDVHCLIMAASFIGNIDPSKSFIENGVRDPSKLYFITAGSYNLIETQPLAQRSRSVLGGLYVRGWLDPNFIAAGELIITENKKSYEIFNWKASPVN